MLQTSKKSRAVNHIISAFFVAFLVTTVVTVGVLGNYNARFQTGGNSLQNNIYGYQTSAHFVSVAPAKGAPANEKPRVIVIPDDYSKIGDAISNALPGDTVFVKKGVYQENLVITKSLSLVGEDSRATVLVGSGGPQRGSIVTIAADNTNITGFTIKSLNYSDSTYYPYGIVINGDNCSIAGNNIQNTYSGIFCAVQSSITISQNNITANLKDGIRFYGGSSNIISGNNITVNTASGIAIEGYSDIISGNNIKNNTRAIGLGSSYTVVYGNNLTGNSESGIYFPGSNDVISANYITDNKYGVYFTISFGAANDNKFYHNNFIDNQQNICFSSSYNVESWDNGAPSGGNYWSDYLTTYPNATKVGNLGIWDLAYVISANNSDRYPLVAPFDTSNTGTVSINNLPVTKPDQVVALWHFDEVQPNDITNDAISNNPAIFGSVTGNVSYTPKLVEGKFGKALSFDGSAYAYVPASPTLVTPSEVTIDAWVNVQSFKNVTYNNIVIESVRTLAKYPTRIVGLAVNGELPGNGSSVPQGALRGYVLTDSGGFNEIVTTDPVIPLNQWTHVTFTRSLTTGMHIYVNGEEKNVNVTYGVLNPAGSIQRDTELYIGHDSISMIDEVAISNYALAPQNQSLWLQWWFWTIVGAAIIALPSTIYFIKKRKTAASL